MKKATKMIRIYADSWKRLKIIAATQGVTLIKLLEELSKKI